MKYQQDGCFLSKQVQKRQTSYHAFGLRSSHDLSSRWSKPELCTAQSFFLSQPLLLLYFLFYFFFSGRSDLNRQEQVIKIRAYFLLGGVKFGNSCLLSPQGDAQMDRGVPDKTWYVCALRFGNRLLNLLPDLTILWPACVLEMEIQRAEFAHHPATH